MLAIILMLAVGVLVAAVVAVYVAYPHRGASMPVVPQLGEAMRKGVDSPPDDRGLRVPRLTSARAVREPRSTIVGRAWTTARRSARGMMIGLRHG